MIIAAVLGRTLQHGVTSCNDCGVGGGDQEEVVYWDSGRRPGPLNSSFALFYIVVITLNSVAIGAGIVSQIDFHRNSNNYHRHGGYMDGWYMCNAIFGVLHILAAIYLVRKIEEPSPPQLHNPYMAAEMIGAASHPQSASQQAIVVTTAPPDMEQPQQQNPPYATAVYNHSTVPQGPTGLSYPSLPPHHTAVATKYYNLPPRTDPESWPRIKEVLCQSQVFALYILVFGAYFIWHKFYDVWTYNQGLLFVMHCADTFIVAAPCAFALSVGIALMRRREI